MAAIHMRRARLEGRYIGRPRLIVDRDAVLRDRQHGFCIRQLAKMHRLYRTSVCRVPGAGRESDRRCGTNDVVVEQVVTAVAAALVVYLIWRQQHDQGEGQRNRDRKDMLLELRRDLDQKERRMLSSFLNLQRRLDQKHRVLIYV